MPVRDYLCTVNMNICYSIDGGYRSYHVPQNQLHNYISYSEHKRRQLSDRLKPARQMTPAPMTIVKEMCENFITSFIDHNIQNTIPDKLIHDGSWKESEEKIADVIKEVLILLEDIWINPAFNSELAKSLNEGTYQSTVILLSIRATLKNLPFRLSSFI
ncbi:15997_t:CDS:2, partial [Funneliformis geosporum]